MAGDSFKNVLPGERLEIPAAAYNAFLDAARRNRALHETDRDEDQEFRQTGIVKVKNATGEGLPRFAVVMLSTPIIGPGDNLQEFQNKVAFIGMKPSDTPQRERFAVLLEPLPYDAIGRAIVAGVTVVKLKVDPANLYDFAAAEKDQTGWLRNVPHGNARVLWIDPSGASERWAVVRLDDGDFQAHVLITSHVPDDDGFYPGEVQRYDVKTKAWITMFECKVVDINA